MKKILLAILLLLACIGVVLYLRQGEQNTNSDTISDGTIRFSYIEDFGLATTRDQVLVSSYIPPCDEGFDYCFYYNGDEFKGTNFESAGVRIEKVPLATEAACLNTPPDGYQDMRPSTAKHDTYSASVFAPIGDAGAGHYASGELYRLYTALKCYEIETRIGETQFANYPEGTIEEFNEADRNKVYEKFTSFLDNLVLDTTGEKIVLPDSVN